MFHPVIYMSANVRVYYVCIRECGSIIIWYMHFSRMMVLPCAEIRHVTLDICVPTVSRKTACIQLHGICQIYILMEFCDV